jgi:hypothetical protein
MTPHEFISELNAEMHTVNDKLLNTLFTRVMHQRDFARLIRITFNDSDILTLVQNNTPGARPECNPVKTKRRYNQDPSVDDGLSGGERDYTN